MYYKQIVVANVIANHFWRKTSGIISQQTRTKLKVKINIFEFTRLFYLIICLALIRMIKTLILITVLMIQWLR
jgi:hypothetical protein